jgi:hypothetical protein
MSLQSVESQLSSKLPVRLSGLSKTAGVLFALTTLAMMIPRGVEAQVLYGSITGNVVDASGGIVPGVRVVATHAGTNQSRETVSNPSGGYTFTNVDAGTYTISATMSGFQKFHMTGVLVSINSVLRVDIPLQVGAVSEQLIVSSTAAALQTDRSDVRFEVESQKLQDLPSPVGRNFQASLRTLPGFTVTGGGAIRGSNPAASLAINVNGAPQEGNNTRIDGATAANNFNQWAAAYVPGLEAIATVEAVSGSYDAEMGLAGGAAINVQIKSGSNKVHGSAFEHHTDNQIKARPALFPVGQGKPKMIFNQLGGTVGGPIKRDKLFYFLSYDGALSRQGYAGYGTVPTDTVKTGNLSESPTPIYDPLTGGPDGSGRTAFPGNIIPTTRISSISQKIIPLWTAPNRCRPRPWST